MKKSLLAALFIGFSVQLFAQEEERTIKFENGRTVQFQLLKNDAEFKSPWYAMVGVYFNRFSYGGELTAGYQLDKIALDASLQIGPNLGLFGLTDENPVFEEASLFTNFNLNARYPLIEKIVTKEGDITIDQESGYRVTTNYMVKQKVSYKRSLSALGGIQFINRAVSENLSLAATDTSIPNAQYFAGSISNVNLKLGLSYDMGTTYAYKLDGVVRTTYVQSSLYASLLVGVATNEVVYLFDPTFNPFSIDGSLYEEASTGYREPDVSSVGFLVGYKAQSTSGGSDKIIMGWGMEAGILPGLADDINWFAGFSYTLGLVPSIKNSLKKG